MNVSKIADVELRYTSLEALDYEPGGVALHVLRGDHRVIQPVAGLDGIRADLYT